MKTIMETVQKPQRPVKVLQFGEGNFLRAFVDWIIDILNEKGGFNGSVMRPLYNCSQGCTERQARRGIQEDHKRCWLHQSVFRL